MTWVPMIDFIDTQVFIRKDYDQYQILLTFSIDFVVSLFLIYRMSFLVKKIKI